MRIPRITAFPFIGCLLLSAGPPASELLGEGAITAREMQAHVDFLASDLLEGRDAGKRGAQLAASYVAAEFQGMGLEKLGESWEMEFELRGGAGSGTGAIGIAGERFEGKSLVEVPRFSAAGSVEALVVTAGTASLEGRIVLTEDLARSKDRREKAEELAQAGAVAVVFEGEEPWIELSSRRGRGRFGTEVEDLPVPVDLDGAVTEVVLVGGEGELEEQIRDQLEEMGIDPSQVQVYTAYGSIDDETLEIDSEVALGGLSVDSIPFGSSGARLSIPALRVCRPLGEALRAAAQEEQEVVLEVTQAGHDSSTNVLGLLKGGDPELAGEYVVVGGHYDHVGVTRRGEVLNGADDNASGTAGVIEIAEAMASSPLRPRRSVVFAAWGAEEKGLVGSRAFLERAPVPVEKIVAYVNLDMIGRNAPAELDVACASEELKGWTLAAAQEHGFAPEEASGMFLQMSDSASFVKREIPTVFLNTGMHRDLHAPGDDPDKIDADKAARAARVALDVASKAAATPERPTFREPERGGGLFGGSFDLPQRPRGHRLGIFPERNTSGEGVVVRRVSSRSYAAEMGLKKGDRIVRIGEARIEKRLDVGPAMKALPAGKEFEVEVRRATEGGGEESLVLRTKLDE